MGILQRIMKNRVDVGLLLLRSFSGYLIIVNHGYRKITGGPGRWEKLGNSMEIFGIDFFPTFWGFMASFAESFCGLLLVLGLFTIPSAFLLTVTMFVAACGHIVDGENPEKALVFGAVFLVFIITGSGKYGLDRKFFRKTEECDPLKN